ncbi:hypothetical protein BGZ94_001415, partial [Podila epigama]
MDAPIEGDKYLRILAHYLRTNQRRLLPQPPTAPTNVNPTTRAILMPADPMAAAYQGMISSLWSATTAVVSSIASSPSDDQSHSVPSDRDTYNGAWDGTGAVAADSSPRERHLHTQAQLRTPILPLDLYYLMYLLERLEQAGIDLENWDGLTPRAIGDSTPRVLHSEDNHTNNTNTNTTITMGTSTSQSAPPTPAKPTTRPQSIRSFQSTAISTLTLITGWKQWSTAAASQENVSVIDDIHFIHRFMKKVSSLRLVSKIPPGVHVQGRGRIEGFTADSILTLLRTSTPDADPSLPPPLLLPVFSLFPALTHLELHKIPPRCVDGWEALMQQLRSLVVTQADIEDAYDVMVTAVVHSERRRLQRLVKEQNRVVQIKQEQQESFKETALSSKSIDTIKEENEEVDKNESLQATNGSSEGQHVESVGTDPVFSPSNPADATASSTTTASAAAVVASAATAASIPEHEQDDATILASLKMWPNLRHLSLSDNGLPALANNNTFSYTQSVVNLDLSHNLLLTPPSGLIHLHNLQDLNLSYNMISGVQSIYQVLGNISSLDLRGNRLESLSGLERLWNLEKVDVRDNHLDDAAEVGRLAALPQIREIWAERNPFCVIQQKHRLEILAVFKANGHDILLDGSYASFIERRALANLSPSAFSTMISSINNVANIPAASAPMATLSKDLSSHDYHHNHHPSDNTSHQRASLDASAIVSPTPLRGSTVNKLVKKKLMKSSKRVKRVVNLDSDHEDEPIVVSSTHADDLGQTRQMETLLSEDENVLLPNATTKVLGSPAAISKKTKKKKTPKGGSVEETNLSMSTSSVATGSKDVTEDNIGKKSVRVKKKTAKNKDIQSASPPKDGFNEPISSEPTSTTSGDTKDHHHPKP